MSSNPFYSFLPWARRGLSNQISEPDTLGPPGTGAAERAQIKTYVHITTDGAATPSTNVNVNLSIVGPGDIVGLNADAIVRTEPANWITNFEPHSFPFIEFYEEDFPWRYTPAKPTAGDKRLRPWLMLVVLKEDEFERVTVPGAPLNAFKINPAIAPASWPLPKHTELWAWAHVSVNDSLSGTTVADKVNNLNAKLSSNPDVAVSRIICPRQLEENTSYYAFLIPTFETGRLAGLGVNFSAFATPVIAQTPAWITGSNQANLGGHFPIYHEWYFRTGATGDFEYLVRQVKPKVLDTRVGKRPIDVHSPGYGLSYTAGTPGTTAGTLMLEGALRIPNNNPAVFTEPYTSPSLKDFINLGEDMLDVSAVNSWKTTAIGAVNLGSDPVITPPMYGRWHALRRKLDTQTNPNLWLNQLNLDPRNRAIAALGGDYVRKNQEKLMDLAWDQVGEVLEGNRKARLAQLALETSNALNKKHLDTQPHEQLIALTGNVHAKVKTSGNVSVLQEVLNSQLPDSADSNAFRKLRRPTGVQMKRVNPNTTTHFNTTLTNMSSNAANSPGVGKTTPNATLFQLSNMNTAMVAVQQYPNAASVAFNISSPTGPTPPPNATVASNFQAVMNNYSNVYNTSNWAALPPLPNAMGNTLQQDLKNGIAPGTTYPNAFSASVNGNPLYTPLTPDTIKPAMTAPSFFISMYKSVQELGLDYFIPNLNLIPQNSITILQSNQQFIESFLAGANYEMARELLWREYPTDQRGTYFRHFWESQDSVRPANMTMQAFEQSVRDIQDIHTWASNTNLGTHSGRAAITNNLVLAIRGDLLKKFPTAVIYAVKAKWQLNAAGTQNDYTKHRVRDTSVAELYPIFSAKVDPDITFLGFDLDVNVAKGAPGDASKPGYYFVIMERPGELRFGLDFPGTTATTLSDWNALTWDDHVKKTAKNYVDLFTTGTLTPTNKKLPPDHASRNPAIPVPADTDWADDSAAMAMITYQNPVMVLIHAHEMLL